MPIDRSRPKSTKRYSSSGRRTDTPPSSVGTVQTKKKKLDHPKLDFSAPWHFSDVVLVVEDRKFHVHRSILSMWSPVFETMFTSEFKEKTSPEIPLPVKCASEIEALLKLIYSRKEQVTDQNFEILLKLADEYEMKEVTDLCVTFMDSILRRETCLHLYALAVKYRLQDFVEKCLKKIKLISLDYINKSKHFLEFELADQFRIISCKAKAAEDALGSNSSTIKNKIFSFMDKNQTILSCEKCQFQTPSVSNGGRPIDKLNEVFLNIGTDSSTGLSE